MGEGWASVRVWLHCCALGQSLASARENRDLTLNHNRLIGWFLADFGVASG